jgi:hypothetical protein
VISTLENQTARLDGALKGMIGCYLPLVNAVTAYDQPTEGPTLLGAGCVRWDERIEQTKSLFNSLDLRKHGVTVEDTTIRDGGKHKLIVDGIDINLDFVDNKTLSFALRRPTQEELDGLVIHWLTPWRPVHTGMYHLTTRRSSGGLSRRLPLGTHGWAFHQKRSQQRHSW